MPRISRNNELRDSCRVFGIAQQRGRSGRQPDGLRWRGHGFTGFDMACGRPNDAGSIEARLMATLHEIVAMLLVERSTEAITKVAQKPDGPSVAVFAVGPHRWLH